MPYIVQEARDEIDAGKPPAVPGELNYLITKAVLQYIGATPSYARYNDVIGVLEAVKLELYRRWVGPYEDRKREENGDIIQDIPYRVD